MKIKPFIFLVLYFLLIFDPFFPLIIKLMATIFVIGVLKGTKDNAKARNDEKNAKN